MKDKGFRLEETLETKIEDHKLHFYSTINMELFIINLVQHLKRADPTKAIWRSYSVIDTKLKDKNEEQYIQELFSMATTKLCS